MVSPFMPPLLMTSLMATTAVGILVDLSFDPFRSAYLIKLGWFSRLNRYSRVHMGVQIFFDLVLIISTFSGASLI